MSIFTPDEIKEYKKITEKEDHYAEFCQLLNQEPITQEQLRKMKALPLAATPELKLGKDDKPVKPPEPNDEDDKPVKPPEPNDEGDKSVKPLELNDEGYKSVKPSEHNDEGDKSEPDDKGHKKQKFFDKAMLEAMAEAMASMSKKSHLFNDKRVEKENKLEEQKHAYENANSPDAAKKALSNFVIEASKQRQSWWGSMFTARFGETASAQALFNSMKNIELKKLICDAVGYNAKPDEQVKFKDFAQHLRNMHEDNIGKDSGHKPGS